MIYSPQDVWVKIPGIKYESQIFDHHDLRTQEGDTENPWKVYIHVYTIYIHYKKYSLQNPGEHYYFCLQ